MTSGFTAQSFVGKLSKLSESQQSIQTLSHWVQYHKNACEESASVWAAEALRAPPKRQLLFVYLANDVIQSSKRKGEEFVKAYGPQLVAVLPRVFDAASASVQGKMLRIVSIWEERKILPDETLTELRGLLSGGAAPMPPPAPASHKRKHEVAVLDDDDEYVPEPVMSPVTAGGAAAGGGLGGGGGMALSDLLVTLDQGSLADELQAERESDLDMRSLDNVEVCAVPPACIACMLVLGVTRAPRGTEKPSPELSRLASLVARAGLGALSVEGGRRSSGGRHRDALLAARPDRRRAELTTRSDHAPVRVGRAAKRAVRTPRGGAARLRVVADHGAWRGGAGEQHGRADGVDQCDGVRGAVNGACARRAPVLTSSGGLRRWIGLGV